MSNVNMFEIASKTKMRFNFKGLISVEDLWDLNTKELDSVFKTLNAQLKQVKEESLLTTKTTEDKYLDTQIEIVKHIFNVKVEENNARLQAKEKKEKKEKLLELLADKQNENLKSKTAEEIQAMLDELNA